MSREAKQSASSPRRSKRAETEVSNAGEATLVRVRGMLDEHFAGFGELAAHTIILDVTGIKFITSFGVRQWLRAMASLPPNARNVYLVGCQRIFVDQLNMILNFGGRGQILTLIAPYRCQSCGAETDEVIDAVAHTPEIRAGRIPERACKKCGNRLVLDELPDMYFACLEKYGPRQVDPAAVALLGSDTSHLGKQVIKSNVQPPSRAAAAAAKAATSTQRSGIGWWIVIGVLLAGLVTGLYILVGPS